MLTFSACALACLLSGADNVVLMEFTADWCGACRVAEPTVKRLIADGYPVHPVNIDRDPQLAAQYGVRSVPCFVLVRGGQEVDRVLGAASYDRLVQMLERARSGTNAVAQQPTTATGTAVRGQSPDGRGLSLPRPLASLTKGFGARGTARRQGSPGPDPIQITQGNPTFSSPASPNAEQPPTMPSMMSHPNPTNGQVQPISQPPATTAATQRAMAATVRLRVEDATGHSLGTGSIIDSHGDESLVATCAHIFRESNGKGRIVVDLFDQSSPRTVEGTLISYDLDRDVALVAIVAGRPVAPVRVAPPGYSLAKGQTVFSVGCDRGANPSVRQSRITSIDRYVGSPNIQVSGMPVDGRSGGGLFSDDGLLIGVCNAADPQDQEGIYASLPVVHWELDKIGQRKIYDPQSEMLASVSQRRNAETGVAAIDNAAQALPSEMPRATVAIATGAATQNIAAAAPANSGDDLEVICIMRSRNNPQASQRVMVFDHPSRALLERLASESQAPGANAIAQTAAVPPRGNHIEAQADRFDPRIPYNGSGQTIRAQSNDR